MARLCGARIVVIAKRSAVHSRASRPHSTAVPRITEILRAMITALGEKGKAMSRYIDADKLAMHLADYQYSIPYGCIDESAEDVSAYMAVGECLKAIDEQPHIDIVRCKECTERDDDWCMYFGKMINPDDFCSYGERIKR